ncbi:MAG: gluconate 2-dehydrogenase subunit 3 family protein [Bryobacteraceae bacterium]|nr:gluconate 2-dehydrogenase subunit 3 family protein [Bryobacteraceae bacterium]
MSEDRRDALKIIGAIGATCAFPFSADELWGQTSPQPSGQRFFSSEDLKLVSRLCNLIIPDTNTPGAAASGVPAYIESVVNEKAFRTGSTALDELANKRNGKPFLALTEDQQIALLTPLCDAVDNETAKTDAELFFGMMKKLTADGYFTSKVGLMQTLGYSGNHVMSEFTGCVHEH